MSAAEINPFGNRLISRPPHRPDQLSRGCRNLIFHFISHSGLPGQLVRRPEGRTHDQHDQRRSLVSGRFEGGPRLFSSDYLLLEYGVMFGFFFVVSLILSGLRRALEHEKKMARLDSLTGVPNARYFIELIGNEIERSRRYKHPLTLAYIDCDLFKDVNDHFGHQTGDHLLRVMAQTLLRNIRGSDIIGRLGGDEFGILMPEIGETLVPQTLDRLHDRLKEAMTRGGWAVTFSMGVAIFLRAPDSVENLIKRADNLMYVAKNSGKDRIQYKVFSEE